MISLDSDHSGAAPSTPRKFHLGQIVATAGAMAKISPDEIQAALVRHHSGDWGELDEHDRNENELGLVHSLRLFSVYRTNTGVRFYIVTEHDRSITTILLPQEY
jgi:hypothetical protein